MNKLKINPALIQVDQRLREDLGDIEELADSIHRYGLIQPIVLNQDNHLIAGGRRLAACHLLGLKEVDVVYKETLSPDDLKEMELEENIRRKDMTWQERALGIAKIHELKSVNAAIDSKSWGYEETAELIGIKGRSNVWYAVQIAALLRANDEVVKSCSTFSDAIRLLIQRKEDMATRRYVDGLPKTQEATTSPTISDELPLGLSKPSFNAGQIAQGMCIHGDCLNYLTSLRYDHIITDPPYAIDTNMMDQTNVGMSNITRVEEEHTVEGNLKLLGEFIQLAYKGLPDHGFLVMWCDPFWFNRLYILGTSMGFRVQRWPLVWVKTSSCMNGAAQYNFTKNIEIAIVMRKPRAVLATNQHTCVISGANIKDPIFNHPFVKPEYLWHWLFNAVVSKGQVVLDPFAGEGSSTLAALSKKINCLAIECNDTHYTYLLRNTTERLRAIGGTDASMSYNTPA